MTDITSSPVTTPALAPPAAGTVEAAPPPAQSAATFEVLPLSREVRETLAELGYVHPTPVQLAVWEPATRGRDAVVQARTGTGKTAAFGLPIVDHIVRRSMPHVQVLALCPTRELAMQVTNEIERIGRRKNVKITAVYGGAPMQRQIDLIADGAQVIVGTPGRVLDHLRRGTLDPKHIKLLVLDESDEMLSMGFEREMTAILDALPKERQTLLFSATLPPDVDRMAKKLRDPEYLTLSGDHIGALEIEHFVYFVSGDKVSALIRMIEVENPEGAIVFCNTRDETERVATTLSRLGYDADWLNGDLPQSDRERVMAKTREGRLRFLVATDVAARGIDISHLTHVINHDFPQDAESYVHRTGRTGRAGRTGTAISLITPQDVGGLYLVRLTYKIRPVERQIPSDGEIKTRAEADLVSMLAEAFASRSPHAEDLALARRLLTHEQSDLIVAGLLREHLGARPDAQREATTARKATRLAPPPPAPRPPPPPKVAPSPVVVAAPPAPPPAFVAPPAAPVIAAPVIAAPVIAAPVIAAPVAERPREEDRGERRAEPPRDDRGDRRPRQDGPRPEGDRGPRGRGRERDRDRGREGRAPRPERAREDYVPVSAADGSREGDPNAAPTRHADFTTWQPPEEEGDDEPILGSGAARHAPIDPIARDAIRAAVAAAAAVAPAPPAPPPAFDQPAAGSRGVDTTDGDLAEIYVNVGRRESARAADFQRLLTEVAGIDKTNVRRIRVRERNAFISVRREDLARALAALTGATIAGKIAAAEQARERGEGESAPEGARPLVAEDATPAEAAPVADGSVEPAVESDAVPTERPSPR